jgi:hypothetical protein
MLKRNSLEAQFNKLQSLASSLTAASAATKFRVSSSHKDEAARCRGVRQTYMT